MQKVKSYKCPSCGMKYKSLTTWGNHVSVHHPECIPQGWSYARYYYYILTGKKNGSCIVCKQETDWNEATQKYERFCKNPECKAKYREMFKNRMMKKYGKTTLLNDPEQQRKMLANRRISGKYTFMNGVQVGYVGTYEKDFLVMLNTFLQFDPNDLMMPSPHTYEYNYKNPNDKEHEGKHFFIPDAYIPSLNLEIEIKQSTNTHPKLLRIDKVKELQKDELMKSIPTVNYIKIVDKDYAEFFDLIQKLSSNVEKSEIATEAMSITTKFDADYQPLEKIKLSSFKSTKLDKLMIDAYKSKVSSLKHAVSNMNTSGEIFIDRENAVGYYQTEIKDNCIWLQSFEICEKYRNHGLANQMLSRAIRRGKITNLSVEIKNEIAIRLFLSYGFFEYARTKELMLMRIRD